MLLSMTGYGRATNSFNSKIITAEVRSLNSKFTDMRVKIPSNYREKEHQLRRHISERIERGKIDFSIEVKSMHGDEGFGLNVPLFKRYYQELSDIADSMGMPKDGLMGAILRIPNVIMSEESGIDEAEWKAVERTLEEALVNFDKFRQAEGKVIEEDMRLRVGNIRSALQLVDPFEQERIQLLRNRMRQNLEEFMNKENIDENRFEQEVIFYLEKIDITEEKVRLEQHCSYYLEQLDSEASSKGRTLSFISQEMGREINTLGAKAYSAEIQKFVVKMKDDLEKIKEQVANSV
ncbi:MAG: YicC family protein [Bacteroidales bacterium]|nr:YicC family protein [Bacteroidales bacterium]